MANELTDELKSALKQLVDHIDMDDQFVRIRQIRQAKKLKFYWSGFYSLWWSETAHDWRVFDAQNKNGIQNDGSYYDKPINVFQAYLQTIIAALSVAIPTINCTPDDSNNSLDLLTAKAGNKIAELVGKHNDVSLLWIHALYIYCTEGLVAAYSDEICDKKYGTYNKKNFKTENQEQEVSVCPECGNQIDAEQTNQSNENELDEFDPDDEDVELHGMLLDGQVVCPQCSKNVDPASKTMSVPVTRMTGITQEPKSRIKLEAFGLTNIKVPNYARNQSQCPYLRFSEEIHYADAIEQYGHLKSLQAQYSNGKSKISPGGLTEPYERWARTSVQYTGEYPINVVTIQKSWVRPCLFNILHDEDIIKALKKRFPDGAKITYVNDLYAESENESLDDHWTLTYNPLSDFVHYDPLGLLLTSVQEITNELVSLVLQTIEHGIGQVFADTSVLNFKQYASTEATPGMIFPVKPKPGLNIKDSFYELRTANLSAEVEPFSKWLEQQGQFTSGAMPGLFGGQQPASSRTAAQFAMQRAQALQRLQTPWKMLNYWWKNIFSKVIPQFIKVMADDEHFTKSDGNGGFTTILIKKAEIGGKLGEIELEASEQLPSSWAQQKDVIMNLMQSPNPMVMQLLTAPENAYQVMQAIGLADLEIPGGDDREKQYEEIQILINSQPMPNPQQLGMQGPQELPSVQVEVLVDNHTVHGEICRNWLVSEAGRMCKTDNAKGYKNVLLHLQQHMQATMQLKMMLNPQLPQTGNGNPGQNGKPPQNGSAANSNGPQEKKPVGVTADGSGQQPNNVAG